jgi:hypothetical protein
MLVITPCPACNKSLSLDEKFAGRRIRCPSCQEVFQVPSDTAVAAPLAVNPAPSPVAPPRPARKAPEPAPSGAVTERASPRRAAHTACPECHTPLAKGSGRCSRCSWQSTQLAVKPIRKITRDTRDAEGGCYVYICGDEVELNEEVEKLMEQFSDTEDLDLRIMPEDAEPPDVLGPKDVVIEGEVTQCDYGSRFIRYWLTIIAHFGPGSSQLGVEVDIETAEGKPRHLKSKIRQSMGFLGGNNEGLMKMNVKIIGKRIATAAARQASGRSMLNAHAYTCAAWALGLGIASLIPFLGIPIGLAGIIVGLIATLTISSRKLPRRKGMALTGLILSILGLLVTGAIIFLISTVK